MCRNCGGQITSKHAKLFCCRSCAQSYNNSKSPKRTKSYRTCADCPNKVSRNKYCTTCFESRLLSDSTTIGDLRGSGNSNIKSRIPYLRKLARTNYISSTGNYKCEICQYDMHIDVCHIIAIKDHHDKTPIREINKIENLIGLCKNHHWELDNGFIDIKYIHKIVDSRS